VYKTSDEMYKEKEMTGKCIGRPYKSKVPNEENAGKTSFFQYVVKMNRDIKISVN
jgi:hypothetical protein